MSSLSAPASPTGATALTYSLSFTEEVTGLAASDFAVGGTATGWTVSGVSGAGVGPYAVGLAGGTPGTVVLTLEAGSVGDVAGNAGPASARSADAVTIVSPSGAPSTPDLEAASDTGSSSSDDVTSSTTPVFTGRASQPSGTVTLLDHGVVIGTATASAGIWTITSSQLAEGAHSVYAVETDDGQPPSGPSAALPVIVDTTAPSVQVLSPAPGETSAIGATSFDVTWAATDSASEVVAATVARDSRALVSGSCPGAWSQDHPGQDGASPFHDTGLALSMCYRWRVTAVDAAGNAATATSGTVTLGDVALTSPVWGDPAFSVETPSAVAQATSGITRVDLLADGAQVASAPLAPFSASWDTTTASAGLHALQARLVRGDGTSELAPSIVVTVDNALLSPERVAVDQARGRLTGSQTALYRVLASADQGLLPVRYRSTAVVSALERRKHIGPLPGPRSDRLPSRPPQRRDYDISVPRLEGATRAASRERAVSGCDQAALPSTRDVQACPKGQCEKQGPRFAPTLEGRGIPRQAADAQPPVAGVDPIRPPAGGLADGPPVGRTPPWQSTPMIDL